jgi:hypothetical protein
MSVLKRDYNKRYKVINPIGHKCVSWSVGPNPERVNRQAAREIDRKLSEHFDFVHHDRLALEDSTYGLCCDRMAAWGVIAADCAPDVAAVVLACARRDLGAIERIVVRRSWRREIREEYGLPEEL